MSIYSALRKSQAKKKVKELEKSQEAAQEKEGKLLGAKPLAKEGLKWLGGKALEWGANALLPGVGTGLATALKASKAGRAALSVGKGVGKVAKLAGKVGKGAGTLAGKTPIIGGLIKGAGKAVGSVGKEAIKWGKTEAGKKALKKGKKFALGTVADKLAGDVTESGLRKLGMGAKPSDIKGGDSIYTEEAAKSIKDSMTEQQEGRKKDWSEAITTSAYANLGYDEEKGTFDKDDAPTDTPTDTQQQEMGQGEQGETFASPSDVKDTSDASKQEMNRQFLMEQAGEDLDQEDFKSYLESQAEGNPNFDTKNWTKQDLDNYLAQVGG